MHQRQGQIRSAARGEWEKRGIRPVQYTRTRDSYNIFAEWPIVKSSLLQARDDERGSLRNEVEDAERPVRERSDMNESQDIEKTLRKLSDRCEYLACMYKSWRRVII